MMTIRKSEERGSFDHGWLKTKHTFSFADYYDPKHMGFKTLRVINDDIVEPGHGFPTHPHRDMEIITYIMEGALQHKDSMGNGSIIPAGDIQYMSAGSGVTHSEFNPSQENRVHLLQIWVRPNVAGAEPRYGQKSIPREEKIGQFRLLVSEGGEKDSIAIRQDTKLYARILRPDEKASFEIENGRSVWLHVARGSLKVEDQALKEGDAVSVTDAKTVNLSGMKDEAEILVFDLV